MVDLAHARLDAAGFAPYYLYRQKDAADGLENTGFARPGTACRYNVAMMSDRRDVFGLGAGASTKRMRPGTSRIDRDVHPLDLATYLERIARLGSLG
jgi:oxygen-independent coproporphyrinogen-3 oxidase